MPPKSGTSQEPLHPFRQHLFCPHANFAERLETLMPSEDIVPQPFLDTIRGLLFLVGAEHDWDVHNLLLLLLPAFVSNDARQWCEGIIPSARSEMTLLELKLVQHLPMRHNEVRRLAGVQRRVA